MPCGAPVLLLDVSHTVLWADILRTPGKVGHGPGHQGIIKPHGSQALPQQDRLDDFKGTGKIKSPVQVGIGTVGQVYDW